MLGFNSHTISRSLPAAVRSSNSGLSILNSKQTAERVKDIGVINKQSPARGHTILFNKDNKHVAIANVDKTVENVRIRSAEEIRNQSPESLNAGRKRASTSNPGSEYAISEDDVTEKFILLHQYPPASKG